jgi:hypothetical protein
MVYASSKYLKVKLGGKRETMLLYVKYKNRFRDSNKISLYYRVKYNKTKGNYIFYGKSKNYLDQDKKYRNTIVEREYTAFGVKCRDRDEKCFEINDLENEFHKMKIIYLEVKNIIN